MMTNLKSYSAKTDQGPYLEINEDDIDIDLINGLFLLFDGFGGSGIGRDCTQSIKESIKHFYTKISLDPDSTLPFFYSPKYLLEGNFLSNAMRYSHKIFSQKNLKKTMSERGGASCVAACLAENILTLATVGNGSVYLLRKGVLSQIVIPDSFSRLSCDQYENYFQTTPMNAFGLFEDLHLSLLEHRVVCGDLIVMLTDGAYGRLSSNEIKDFTEKKKMTLSDRIEEIFKLSNKRGNLDNQSAIMLQF